MTKHYFMDDPEYWRDKERISGESEYLLFQKKWFDTWPLKNEVVWEAEMNLYGRHEFEKDGKKWHRFILRDDLSPEELYEFFSVLCTIRYKYCWPDWYVEKKDRVNHWEQICPACQIYTRDLGAEKCPLCGRVLLYQKQVIIEGEEWTADL